MRLLPGRYRGSISFEEAITVREGPFWFLERAIREKCPGCVRFSHWGVTAIPRAEWLAVLAEWQALKSRAQLAALPIELQVLRYVAIDTRVEFLRDFSRNCRKLTLLIDQVSSWLMRELETHEEITLLGI